MNKGIVMEISDRSIIVMRPDGHFDRVPRKSRSCEIGEEIEYAVKKGIDWRSPSVAGRSAIVAAVVFCLVLFASFNGKLGSPEVVAYVSMDINPSIEMGIDAEENVLELRGLNGDGEALIEAVDFKGKKLETVTGAILDKAEQSALAKGEAEIIIASTSVKEGTKVSDAVLAEKVRQQVTKHIAQTHPTQVSSYHVAAMAAPQEVRAEADKNGVSMGKYAVYLNAKNSGTPVTIDELKKNSVKNIAKEKPEVSKALESSKLPTKEEIKKLVQEEKSGQLDKKVEEKQKDAKNNGSNNGNNSNKKDDPKKPSTPAPANGKNPGTSSGSGTVPDKKDDKKDDKDADKKENKKETQPAKPAVTNPSSQKPGATGPGTARPGNTDKDDEENKKQDAKKAEEERRREEARRLEEQKKQEAQKKEQEKKTEEDDKKKDEPKKAEDTKTKDTKDDPKKDEKR